MNDTGDVLPADTGMNDVTNAVYDRDGSSVEVSSLSTKNASSRPFNTTSVNVPPISRRRAEFTSSLSDILYGTFGCAVARPDN